MGTCASNGLGIATRVFGSQWFVSVPAVLIALAIGAVLIALSGAPVVDAYYAIFYGSIMDPSATNVIRMIRPLANSLFYSIPLIISSLGLALGFRAGLSNIGGKGQIIVGALAAVWVGFTVSLPPVLHTLVALLVAVIAGGLYGGIAGVLKAKTDTNEVIVTIMLNSIATLGSGYTLTQKAWQVPGANQPVTPGVAESMALARLLPTPFKLHVGFLVALVALVAFWWLIERSTLGFQICAVGTSAATARTADISVERITAITMVLPGAFLGLVGANETLRTIGYVSRDVTGSIGFDAITVALLGRNKTWGTFGTGLLLGAFKTGGYTMQAKSMPIDTILILQSVIVLLIAAPAPVRWLFHLPDVRVLAANTQKGNVDEYK